eukprot:2736709-Rhodomonas_salina.1
MRDSYLGGTTISRAQTPGDASRGACVYEPNVVSLYPRAKMPSYDDLQSVRLDEQPFVVAGDAS